MKYTLDHRPSDAFRDNVPTSIQIAVEAREVATGNVQAKVEARSEGIVRRAQLNAIFVHSPGVEEFGARQGVAVAGAKNAGAQIDRVPVRRNRHAFRREISVASIRRGMNDYFHWVGNFSQLGERL
jgi:hypothetical protein